MEINTTRNRIIIFGSIAAVVVLSIVLIFLAFVGTSRLTVTGKVSDINYSVNGVEYTGKKTLSNLRPGKYTVTSLNNIFLPEKYEFQLTPFSNKVISLKNSPAKEEDAIDPDRNLVKYFDGQAKIQDKRLSDANSRYPITAALPYFGNTYIFDFSLSDSGDVNFYVQAQPDMTYDKALAKTEVDKYISSNKFDLKDKTVIYQ